MEEVLAFFKDAKCEHLIKIIRGDVPRHFAVLNRVESSKNRRTAGGLHREGDRALGGGAMEAGC